VTPLAAGVLAAAALSLLPGLLVVRAPWTAVPAPSLSLWALAAWWPLVGGLGRGRFVWSALLVFGLLALLRLLPKHVVPPPPGWPPPPCSPPPERPGRTSPRLATAPSLLVLTVALVLLVPLPLWHHAPGPRLAFQTTTARLLMWRDGIPATAEPLLPVAPVGAHAPALATLAADVSHLSGLDPALSLVLVVIGAAGLLLIGLFALQATWAPPRVAALGAIVGLAAAPFPAVLSPFGEGEALLALAFALPASALLLGRASRSSAVAAGMLLAAAALAQPLLAAGMGALVVGVAWRRASGAPARGGRLALALAVALGAGAPGLWPLFRALSLREVAVVARSIRLVDLLPLSLGTLLAGLVPLLLLRVAEARSRAGRVAAAGLALVGAALLVGRVHRWVASGQLPPPIRAALARVAVEAHPFEAVCGPEGVRDWVPALAGREAGEPGPWVPPVYADEWAARTRRPCRTRLEAFLPVR
jgi:hypothetical protein